jgi:hypothetical protein
MDTVVCKELIVTTLKRRGKGTKYDPKRVITEVYEKDGTFVAEHDPKPFTFSRGYIIEFGKWVIERKIKPKDINIDTVTQWENDRQEQKYGSLC